MLYQMRRLFFGHRHKWDYVYDVYKRSFLGEKLKISTFVSVFVKTVVRRRSLLAVVLERFGILSPVQKRKYSSAKW